MCLNLGRKEFGSETRTDIGNYNDYGCLNSLRFSGILRNTERINFNLSLSENGSHHN